MPRRFKPPISTVSKRIAVKASDATEDSVHRLRGSVTARSVLDERTNRRSMRMFELVDYAGGHMPPLRNVPHELPAIWYNLIYIRSTYSRVSSAFGVVCAASI